MPGVSSANPQQLEAAAQAVPLDIRSRLDGALAGLREKINRFNSAPQSPERLRVSYLLDEAMSLATSAGANIDTFLLRVAAAFRNAGGDRSDPNFMGPVVPSPIRYLDDLSLGKQLGSWNNQQLPLQFRRTSDGAHEVLGPDGSWYRVVPFASAGSRPMGTSGAQTVDLGNPEFGLALSVGAMGQAAPPFLPAPPSAYEALGFTEDGAPITGSSFAGSASAPRGKLPGLDADNDQRPPTAQRYAGGIGAAQDMLAGAVQYASFEHRNVYRTHTTFYMDPQHGQRVAAIDAAQITYDQNNNALVNSGRLDFDEDGRPQLSPGYDLDCRPDPHGGRTSFRIPLKASN